MRNVGKLDWGKLRQDIAVTDIDEAMLTHADLFLEYASSYTKALAVESEAKFNYERKLSLIRVMLRDNISATEGSKAVSEARLDRELPMQIEAQKAKEEWVEAEEVANEWRMAMEAIRIRKDLLIQLSANRREEMAQGIRETTDITLRTVDAVSKIQQIFGNQVIPEDQPTQQ